VIIRDATSVDIIALTEIHNEAIRNSRAIWIDDEVERSDREAWLAQHRADGHPVLVAEVDGAVVGYASYGWYRPRSGYRFTVESSVYLRAEAQRAGIGRALMVEVIAAARAAGMHSMIAAVEASNTGSIALHELLGFVEVGRLPQAGLKYGEWLDLVLMQLMLGEA
jgi:phosphinothricin acetyltransferase